MWQYVIRNETFDLQYLQYFSRIFFKPRFIIIKYYDFNTVKCTSLYTQFIYFIYRNFNS